MAMSGVTVEDEVSTVYHDMKINHTIEYMILTIGDSKQGDTQQDQTSSKKGKGNKTVQIAKKVPKATQQDRREEIADMLVADLTTPDLSKRFCPCYVVYDQPITTGSGQTKKRLIFIHW